LFLDRDQAGQSGCRQAQEHLHHHDLDVEVFDWHQFGRKAIQDPADMSVEQLQSLHRQKIF
jgi:hypothetical protein